MAKRHFFIGQFDWQNNIVVCSDSEVVHQIKDVLKIQIGEEVKLGDGLGKTATAVLKKIDKKTAEFLVVEFLQILQNKKQVVLCAAILKRDSFEWLLQKAVEVGVDEIVPLISERTVKIGTNEKRWQKIIKEAAEQSERQFLPKLHATQTYNQALKINKEKMVLFDPSGMDTKGVGFNEGSLTIFVGPEGGWTENEIQQAVVVGAKVVKIGDTILRGETAAVVATYLAKNIF